MPLTKADLSRRFVLDVTKSGHVFIREAGSGLSPHGGLPVFSTSTREQAKRLVIRHCRLERDGSGLYRLNEFSGEIEDLGRVANLFRASLAGASWRELAPFMQSTPKHTEETMPLPKIVSKNLKSTRLQKRLSQEALASMAGLSISYISMLERGQRCPPLDTLESLAKALKVHPATLLQNAA